ncbi:MAG: RNA polymerase sigma factor [Planctomycetes bacterium]|nr:RNA polymerase sigma factor [Planctomycetota bacterium]
MAKHKQREESLAQELEALMRQRSDNAWRLAYALLGNHADAEDALQQSFVVILAKGDTVPRPLPWPWFVAVLSNVARNLRRRRATRRSQPLEDANMAEASQTKNPASQAEAQELARIAADSLAELAEDQRDAITFTVIAGLSHAEAAELRGVNVNTQKAQARRGIESLRGTLARNDAEVVQALGAAPLVFAGTLAADQLAEMVHCASANVSLPIGSGLLTTLGTQTTEIIVMSKALVASVAVAFGITLGAVGTLLALPEKEAAKAELEAALVKPQNDTSLEAERRAHANTRTILSEKESALSNLASAKAQREEFLLTELNAAKSALESERAARSERQEDAKPFALEQTKNLAWLASPEFEAFAKEFRDIHELYAKIQVADRKGLEASDADLVALSKRYREVEAAYGSPFMLLMGTLPRHSSDALSATLTHPGIVLGLWQAWLREAEMPLSEGQLTQVQEAARAFEKGWEDAQSAYTEETLKFEKVADEWRLKQAFQDRYLEILNSEQRSLIVPREIQGHINYQRFSPIDVLNEHFIFSFDEERLLDLTEGKFAEDFGPKEGFMIDLRSRVQVYLRDSMPYRGLSGRTGERTKDQIEGFIPLQVTLFKDLIAATNDEKQKKALRDFDRLLSPGVFR